MESGIVLISLEKITLLKEKNLNIVLRKFKISFTIYVIPNCSSLHPDDEGFKLTPDPKLFKLAPR